MVVVIVNSDDGCNDGSRNSISSDNNEKYSIVSYCLVFFFLTVNNNTL